MKGEGLVRRLEALLAAHQRRLELLDGQTAREKERISALRAGLARLRRVRD